MLPAAPPRSSVQIPARPAYLWPWGPDSATGRSRVAAAPGSSGYGPADRRECAGSMSERRRPPQGFPTTWPIPPVLARLVAHNGAAPVHARTGGIGQVVGKPWGGRRRSLIEPAHSLRSAGPYPEEPGAAATRDRPVAESGPQGHRYAGRAGIWTDDRGGAAGRIGRSHALHAHRPGGRLRWARSAGQTEREMERADQAVQTRQRPSAPHPVLSRVAQHSPGSLSLWGVLPAPGGSWDEKGHGSSGSHAQNVDCRRPSDPDRGEVRSGESGQAGRELAARLAPCLPGIPTPNS